MARAPSMSTVVTIGVTAVVSVFATLAVVGAIDITSNDDEPRAVPSTGAEIDEYALALLPEPDDDAWTHTMTLAGVTDTPRELFVVPPGEYELHLACETIARQNARLTETRVIVRSGDDVSQYLIPCPSTPVVAPDPIIYTEHIAMTIYAWDVDDNAQSFAVAAMITGTRAQEPVD